MLTYFRPSPPLHSQFKDDPWFFGPVCTNYPLFEGHFKRFLWKTYYSYFSRAQLAIVYLENRMNVDDLKELVQMGHLQVSGR